MPNILVRVFLMYKTLTNYKGNFHLMTLISFLIFIFFLSLLNFRNEKNDIKNELIKIVILMSLIISFKKSLIYKSLQLSQRVSPVFGGWAFKELLYKIHLKQKNLQNS